MGVDGRVPRSASQVLALPVGNVLPVTLDVSLGQAEVQNEDLVTGFVQPHTEVIGLNVSVDEVAVVNVLNPADHLVDEHQHCL